MIKTERHCTDKVSYLRLKGEIEKIVRKCIFEIGIDERKFHFHPTFTTEKTFDLRYGIYVICVIRIDPLTNDVKFIELMTPNNRDKRNRSKSVVKPIKSIAEIENYKDMMLANLKYYL